MQSKRFDETELATIPPTTGINTLVIENNDDFRVNFHGIRYKGRILVDNTSANIFQNGYIALLCVPNDFIPTTGIFDIATMRDMNEMIIAIEPWSMFSNLINGSKGYGTVYDFDIAPKTSRTCSMGGKIVGQVTNEGLGNVVVNALLSTFSTTV